MKNKVKSPGKTIDQLKMCRLKICALFEVVKKLNFSEKTARFNSNQKSLIFFMDVIRYISI